MQNEKDPRGKGSIEEPNALESDGYPNIVDYSDKEPFLYQAGENSSHDYPGKIVVNNESDYIDRTPSKATIPGPAETGKESVGADRTQPGLTTGAPQEPAIAPNEQNLFKQIVATTQKLHDEETQNMQSQPLTHDKDVVLDGEKSDTGEDHSRTGPGGNNPQENNDPTHYEGESDTKLNVATGIEITPEITKELYNVDGTIPELKENIEIDIDGLEQKIEINIDDKTTPKKTTGIKKKLDLKNSPGRKNPETNVPTIQAGKKSIEDTMPISDIWKDTDEFKFSESKDEALILSQHRHPDEFDWMDDDTIKNMIDYSRNHGTGKFMLVVLSGESITDHRPEGEEIHRRRWNQKEMMQNIRTAKGKMIDINHVYQKKDMQSGGVYDANWNFKTNKGEVILWETDNEILDAIKNNIITAVSIHTGKPRKIETNCEDGECFLEPSGTILGEDDNIALAYVVTDPRGFDYNGYRISAAPPGMPFTKIYMVE